MSDILTNVHEARVNRPEFVVLYSLGSQKEADPGLVDSWFSKRGIRRADRFLDGETGVPGVDFFPHFAHHWYVRKNGAVTRGRWEDEPGAHTDLHMMSERSISILFEGNGDREDFTTGQVHQLSMMLRRIFEQYPRIRVGGTTRVIGYREIPGAITTDPGMSVNLEGIREYILQKVIDSLDEENPMSRELMGRVSMREERERRGHLPRT